tara:strand:+ start:2548 stop:3543 length:996 start_codon:yes stop_codon:yes gene_type:complete
LISAYQIAKFIKGELVGEDLSIKGAIDLLPGEKSCISFLDEKLNKDYLYKTKSDLVIVSENVKYDNLNKTIIKASNPKKSFFDVVEEYFYNPNYNSYNGIHDTAIISKTAKIGPNVSIGPNSIISNNVYLEGDVSISANCFIGEDTEILRGSVIHPNVTIYNNILIKNNVIINSGSIIGASGFGVIKDDDGELIKVPHIGSVEIQDNVILGAGCTVDRATMSKTVIGSGTKIDGQVHIAHNVKIGKNCIIAGQAAIGGSSTLGNNVILGGQVGVIDNLSIGNNCVVAAKSAVMKSLDSDSVVSGIPAINHSKKLRLDVLYSRLPELFKKNN